MEEKFGKSWVLLIYQVDLVTLLTDGREIWKILGFINLSSRRGHIID